MSDFLSFLQQRSSCAKLDFPALSHAQLEHCFQAANRAPDHGRLQPWRFLVVEGQAREALGDFFASAAKQDNPALDETSLAGIKNKALRAPQIIVGIVKTQEHLKVPKQEQKIAAACALYQVLLAANAQGFAGIWRTGSMAYNKTVRMGLGLADNEFISGFLYLGSAIKEEKASVSCASWQYWGQ